VDSGLGRLRADFRRTIDRYAPGDLNALFKALALGDRRGLTATRRESFARTGTSHLLAISGLHIGLLAGLIFAVSRWIFRRVLWLLSPHWAEAGYGDVLPGIAAGVAAASYVALAGAPISGRRALAMLSLYLLIRRLRRDTSSWNVLGGAAGIVLLCDPKALTELGLHLSLVSVAGLLLIPRRKVGVTRGSSRVVGLLRSSLLASVATAFATAPLCALIWGRLAISGLWVNVVAIALLGAGTVPPLLLGCLVGAVHDGLARPFLMLASVCASWGLRLITAAAQPEWSPMLYWQPGAFSVGALYFGLAALLLGGVLARRWWGTKGRGAEDGEETHASDRSGGPLDSSP
jgi:competence protein ComEC